MTKIGMGKRIAREILDSRGNPTVEVDIMLDEGTITIGRAPIRQVVRIKLRHAAYKSRTDDPKDKKCILKIYIFIFSVYKYMNIPRTGKEGG